MVEAGGVQGVEESMPASVEKKSEVPNEVLPASHGKRGYQKGDRLEGTVVRITAEGVYLDYEDLDVLIPVKGKDASQFWIGDMVQAVVQEVKEDGTLIMDTYLELEDDENEVSSTELRKWKYSSPGKWWQDSWYAGQWDQNSFNGQWSWEEEEWQCYGWSANEWVFAEDWEEGVQKQLCGERIYRVLLGDAPAHKEYLGKITGMLLDRRLEEVKELVADSALMKMKLVCCWMRGGHPVVKKMQDGEKGVTPGISITTPYSTWHAKKGCTARRLQVRRLQRYWTKGMMSFGTNCGWIHRSFCRRRMT